jgi:hypothetical protein
MKDPPGLSKLILILLATTLLSGCFAGGGGHGGGGGGGGGSLPQVTLTSPNGTVTDIGESIKGITATVTNDASEAGVTWVNETNGTLSNITTVSDTSTLTLVAPPASMGGLVCPFSNQTLEAEATANTKQFAQLNFTFNCLPSISSTLPLGVVGGQYSGSLSASAGTGSMTWVMTAGALPPGLTATPSATTVSITGTPTQSGTFSFTYQATDSVGGQSQKSYFSITIEPGSATACVLAGHQYAFLTGSGILAAGSIQIAADGSLTGEYDVPYDTSPGPYAITGGRCSAGTVPNTGTITFTSGDTVFSGFGFPTTFSFAMRGSDLATGRIIETGFAGPAPTYGELAIGEIELQSNPPAFGPGSYAFGLFSQPGVGGAWIGSFCSDSNSNLTFLQADEANPGAEGTNFTTFSSSGTGGYSSLDSYGRFTNDATPFTLSDGDVVVIAFYAVRSGKAFASSLYGGSQIYYAGPMVGQVTGQPGSTCPQQAGSFSNNSLTASVYTLKGSAAQVGLVENINPSAGTLNIIADQNSAGTASTVSISSASYSISSAGRGSFNLTDSYGNVTPTIFYPDGLGNAYLIGALETYIAYGFATAQGTSTAPVTDTYASGQGYILPVTFSSSGTYSTIPATEIALDATALTLTDQTAGGSSGTYAPDTSNPGRYTATLDNAVTFGDTSIVFYVVDANKIVAMGLTSATPALVDLQF